MTNAGGGSAWRWQPSQGEALNNGGCCPRDSKSFTPLSPLALAVGFLNFDTGINTQYCWKRLLLLSLPHCKPLSYIILYKQPLKQSCLHLGHLSANSVSCIFAKTKLMSVNFNISNYGLHHSQNWGTLVGGGGDMQSGLSGLWRAVLCYKVDTLVISNYQ